MEKEFVIYPLALRMKALGYNGPCFGYYVDGELRGVNLGIEQLGGIKPYYQRFGFHALSNHDIENPKKIVVTAPTFSQAFRWFREKYEIEATTSCFYSKRLDIPYEERQYHCHIIRDGVTSKGPKYESYEEAELACLEKLIEIVENIK
jgi:hypothetical protein